MATFTVTVRSTSPKQAQPIVLSQQDNSCLTDKVIRVFVPVGQSRYVSIIYSGIGGSYNETITDTTDYTLLIDRARSSDPLLNNQFSTGYIRVAISSGNSFFYTTGITRNHTINIC
jgi:hypothetical protein